MHSRSGRDIGCRRTNPTGGNPQTIPLKRGEMNKLPLKAKFFTKVSYAKSEPRIAVAPVDTPNYEQAIAIGENPASDLEGNITLADETGEILGMSVKQFGVGVWNCESSDCIEGCDGACLHAVGSLAGADG